MEFDLAVRIEDFREASNPVRSSIVPPSIVDSSCVHPRLFLLFSFRSSDILFALSSILVFFFLSHPCVFLLLLTTPLLPSFSSSLFLSPPFLSPCSFLFTRLRLDVRASSSCLSLLDIRTRASSPCTPFPSPPVFFFTSVHQARPFSLVAPLGVPTSSVAVIVNTGGNSSKKFEPRGPLERATPPSFLFPLATTCSSLSSILRGRATLLSRVEFEGFDGILRNLVRRNRAWIMWLIGCISVRLSYLAEFRGCWKVYLLFGERNFYVLRSF